MPQRPWRNPDFQTDLHRMLRLARATSGEAPHPNEPHLLHLDNPPLLFQGESLTLFRSLQMRMVGSSHHGGLSPDEAQRQHLTGRQFAFRLRTRRSRSGSTRAWPTRVASRRQPSWPKAGLAA